MARTEARLRTSIWSNKDFLALPGSAQRLYMLILSQPDLSFCGVLPLTDQRWARMASDTTPKAVRADVKTLVDATFLLLDDQTEETMVRTLAKGDGILKSPNLILAMGRDWRKVHSERLREAFVEGLPEGFGEGFPEGIQKRLAEGLPDPIRERSRVYARALPVPHSPSPSPPSIDNSSSTSDSRPAGEPVDDDDRRRLETETLDLLGKRHLADRMRPEVVARLGPVGDVVAWLGADREKTTERHGERFKALTAGSAAELAELLEPTPGAATVTPPPFRSSETQELPVPEEGRARVEAVRAALKPAVGQ